MDRPATSKARGACRYYMTPRGCFAGDSCKFLHGQEQLTPYDQSKSCRFYAQGYCRRGDKCWFRHTAPGSFTAPQDDELTGPSAADDVCNICLEKPITYGLLTGCGHVFCIKCIRQWRDPAGKSGEMSGVIKKCPLCRAPSRYITPSSISFPHNHPGKAEAINKYKTSMARVPCRYFQLSMPSKRFCPFGKDCFYQHLNDNGTAYIFPRGIDYYMKLYKFRQSHGADISEDVAYHATATGATIPLNIFSRLFSNNTPLNDIHTTIEVLRANLPALLDRFNAERDLRDITDDEEDEETEHYQNRSNGSNNGSNGDYGDADRADTQERWADRTLESFVALHENAQPSSVPVSHFDWNITEALDDDELPPLEPLYVSSSESLSSRETPSPALLSSLPHTPSVTTAATSRFSTVVGNRSQERVLIDLVSEDEEDENGGAASEVVEQVRVVNKLSRMGADDSEQDAAGPVGEDREMVWLDNNVVQESLPSVQETEAGTLGRRTDYDIGPQTVANNALSNNDIATQISPAAREHHQVEHDAEPPFVTDGRGRVVWSSMRSAQGAQSAIPRESPAPPQVTHTGMTGTTTTSERRTKTRRTVRESNSAVADTIASSAITTDGRGRVIWTGSPAPADAAADGDGATEVGADIEDTESVVERAEPSQNAPRRSFFGRVYDVVFA